MAITQYPNAFWVRIAETNKELKLANISLAARIELKYIQLFLVKVGTAGGSEQMRVKVYADPTYTTAIATSSYVTLASMDGIGAGAWLGQARFDFARENLAASQTYYLAMQLTSYTRNGTTFYIGAKTDWPDAVGSGGGSKKSARVNVFGYRQQN